MSGALQAGHRLVRISGSFGLTELRRGFCLRETGRYREVASLDGRDGGDLS